AFLLLFGGAGALVWLNAAGGTAESNFSITRILAGEAREKQRVRMAVQAVEFHNRFNPVVFEAIDIVPEGQQPRLDAQRIRVSYDGKDKIALEPYSHVAIEGVWNEQEKVFHASSMVTRCPSHYEQKGKPPQPVAAPKS
ncbi:MAG: cytochrome c maturation protein CcmE, partial [Planctomycetes bacterium]|nr:cytochrome c maturation protein CcmE [Planctomycetota bacterium]